MTTPPDPAEDAEHGSPEDAVEAAGDEFDLEIELDELVAEAERAAAAGPFTVSNSCEEALEDALTLLEQVTAERDEYLDLARRGQAEFENYRRRVDGQRLEQVQRAAESLVSELLPVLDACEAALAHGAEDVLPVQSALFGILLKQGLDPITDVEVPFDPTVHEAVLTEPAGDTDDEVMVAEVLRSGYSWNGRVLRPAMVKVRG